MISLDPLWTLYRNLLHTTLGPFTRNSRSSVSSFLVQEPQVEKINERQKNLLKNKLLIHHSLLPYPTLTFTSLCYVTEWSVSGALSTNNLIFSLSLGTTAVEGSLESFIQINYKYYNSLMNAHGRLFHSLHSFPYTRPLSLTPWDSLRAPRGGEANGWRSESWDSRPS